MRHSFLPIQNQKSYKKEYLNHAIVIVLFLLAVGGLIGVVSLFPAYIQVYIEEVTQSNTIAQAKNSKEVNEVLEIEKELRSDMGLINNLTQAFSDSTNSEIIEQIIAARGTVLINSIDVKNTSTSTAEIFLIGTAPTRESLISYRTRLEILTKGNKIELPISGLAKNKDIPFSLKVTKSQP